MWKCESFWNIKKATLWSYTDEIFSENRYSHSWDTANPFCLDSGFTVCKHCCKCHAAVWIIMGGKKTDDVRTFSVWIPCKVV